MKANKTNKLIYKMLTENTGVSMLDSGRTDGRSWQKNQKKTIKDFEADPVVTWDGDQNDDGTVSIYPTVSVFHYLSEVLELDEICNKFNKLKCNDWDSSISGVSNDQKLWLKKTFSCVDFSDDSRAWNTCNSEGFLNQGLQRYNICLENSNFEYPDYVLIQIHGGADVRGGYTDAKLFKLGKLAEYIDPTPWQGVTINGIDYDTGYNGFDLRDENRNAPKGNIDKILENLNTN